MKTFGSHVLGEKWVARFDKLDRLLHRLPIIQTELKLTSPRSRPSNGEFWWFPEFWIGTHLHRQARRERWVAWSFGFGWLGVEFGVGVAWCRLLPACGNVQSFNLHGPVRVCDDVEGHLGKHTNTEYKDASGVLIRW